MLSTAQLLEQQAGEVTKGPKVRGCHVAPSSLLTGLGRGWGVVGPWEGVRGHSRAEALDSSEVDNHSLPGDRAVESCPTGHPCATRQSHQDHTSFARGVR